ncbi:tetratricopeptide repeat protein [Oceanospirillum sediminis]|uniref:Tetratricopeptide repeat protein n=1 Tax=Oceanospirillum sediminis TaxID=2760088 RepID=A0A839IU48_9GAMM|nr:tetratricopeptide repeat protein [Oceanospirillum sediminis]MBB1488210.1 tetratricopeptide repeat protein [Oceanospirillum sediminis]
MTCFDSIRCIRYLLPFCLSFLLAADLKAAGEELAGASPSVQLTAECPALPYVSFDADVQQWLKARSWLSKQMPLCLDSAEFFALYGASLLNTRQLDQALEMLERALLLDPENGGALVDYSQALYLNGQLMAALQLNMQLLMRSDLPDTLRPYLEQRQSYWEQQAVSWRHNLMLKSGYDSNLSGMADLEYLTLTIDGVAQALPLHESSKPVEGHFGQIIWQAQRSETGTGNTQHLRFYINSKFSDYSFTDVTELRSSYQVSHELLSGSVSGSIGVNHIFYGGHSLSSGVELDIRYQWRHENCRPYAGMKAEQKFFPGQKEVNDTSIELTAGTNCRIGHSRLSAELDYMNSQSAYSRRPGGDRAGISALFGIQYPFGKGVLHGQVSLSDLNDAESYSPLLSDGEARRIFRSGIVIQYLYPVADNITLMASVSRQRQKSNLELFHTRGTRTDLGLAFSF